MSTAETAIKPRNLSFHLDEAQGPFWNAGAPMRSAVLDALSIGFPYGEKFFIDSVKAFADRVDDPKLRADVKAFVVQESLHTREHVLYNNFLAKHGAPVAEIEGDNKRLLDLARSRLSRRQQLALTVCLEHFTAVFAHQLMSEPAYLKGANPNFRRVWLWHALEEAEHKSVAFDVFVQATPSALTRYRMRCIIMTIAISFFVHGWMRDTDRVLKGQGVRTGWRTWATKMNVLWGRPGLLRRMVLPLLSFYRPGFHPWAHDNRATAARVEAELAAA